ncbi:MAG: hypothetical protein ACKVQS_06030 [Fimbriimonadaceae bacterium]
MASTSIRQHFKPGLDSLRAMWPPMLLVQSIMIAVIIGYFRVPIITSGLNNIADFKDQPGIWFVLASGFIAGGFIPEIAKPLVGRMPKLNKEWLSLTIYTSTVYMGITLIVYYMFKFQVVMFGDDGSPLMVAKKVIFDQLIFSPFLSIPLGVGLFKWRQQNFRFTAWQQVTRPELYKKNVFPALIMCWAYWGPITIGMYFLPEKVQFIASTFCQAAWSLLFVFMVQKPHAVPNPPPE